MLYRRTPRNPPTLLLRIVASAGAGTLIGMASCGGETSTANGSVVLPASSPSGPQPGTPGDDDSGPPTDSCLGLCGVSGVIDSGPVGVAPCSPCGVVVGSLPYTDGEAPDGSVSSPDASVADVEVADVEVHGVVPLPEDAGYDAHRPIGVLPIGVVVEPPDADRITCPPLCGVVVGIGPFPGH